MRLESPRLPSPTTKPVPAGACDAHTHVFGPPSEYPIGPASYAIPSAPSSTYLGVLDTTGMTHGVVVQPDAYGMDTQVLEEALHRGGHRLAGIALADASVSHTTLERLHSRGVRGLRFNIRADRRTGNLYSGSVGIDSFYALAPKLKELGWHAEVWAGLGECLQIAQQAERYGVPVVFDHMAQPNVDLGVGDPDFQLLLRLLSDGKLWVKLAVCRFWDGEHGYAKIRPFHDELIQANPQQLVWGSDWPFLGMGVNAPDVGRLVDIFQDWVSDQKLIESVLVSNPKSLYGLQEIQPQV